MNDHRQLTALLALASLENLLLKEELDLVRDAFSLKSGYLKVLTGLLLLIGATCCAIVGIGSVNVIFFIISLVLQVAALYFVYTNYHPNQTLYFRDDYLTESFIKHPWTAQECRVLLAQDLQSAKAGIPIKTFHRLIRIEKKALSLL